MHADAITASRNRTCDATGGDTDFGAAALIVGLDEAEDLILVVAVGSTAGRKFLY